MPNSIMKNKKAQLTIFIIISILIVAVVVLFLTLRGNLNLPGKPVSPETAEIQNFVQTCLDDSLERVVFRVGENGGYYFPPKVSTPILEIPYYIKDNKNLMPTKENIGNEISKYVSRELVLCLGDFALFIPKYNVTKGAITTTAKIEPEKVLVELNYPLTIIKGDSKSKIEDFNSEVPVRLGIVYDAAAEFVGGELETGEGICADCLIISFAQSGLKSNIFWEDDKTAIFIVRDYFSIMHDKEFVFNFAGKYS